MGRNENNEKDTLSIKILPGYKSDDPNLSDDEKSARKFLETAHNAMIALGRLCYVPAAGISIFAFFAGGLLPAAALPVLAKISSVGWTAWQINIAARTTVFYFLGSPLTDAAVWIKKALPKGKARLSKKAELAKAIEWKAVQFSTDYVREAEVMAETMTELDIQRMNISDYAKIDPKYAKKLIKEYRKRLR